MCSKSPLKHEFCHEILTKIFSASSSSEEMKKSTPGVGAQYEINVPAYFALKLNSNKDVKDFSIRSNVSAEFGNLDDVIIEATLDNGKCLNVAIQLKHRENECKKISPEAFESSKGDYSLEKYCAAFKKIPEDKRPNYHYIIYTNQNFDNSRKNQVKTFTMVQNDQCTTALFNTSANVENTYKFEVNDETALLTSRTGRKEVTKITKDDYRNFFSKFTLYTCQKKFQEFEQLILEILKEQSVVNSYLTLFRKWHQGLFNNRTIDRKTINIHLVDIYLSSFKTIDYRLCDNEDQKMYLFEKATKEFDVTVIADCKENFLDSLPRFNFDKLELKSSEKSNFDKHISQYKMDSASTLTECMLRLAKEYKFIERTEKGLDENLKRKIFSFCFQNLLIVDFNPYSVEAAYKLMENYQLKEDKIKFIWLGHGVDLSKLSAFQVFHNLDNLSKTNNQLYQKITRKCMISLHGRRPVPLKQLLDSLDDVNTIFETKEIVGMLKTGCVIGEEKIKLPSHYIPRNLSTTVFDLLTILNSAKDHKNIIIVNFDNNRLQRIESEIQNEGVQLVEISQYIGNEKTFADKSVIFFTKEPNPEKEIETLGLQEPTQSTHIFKMIADDMFILIRSTSRFSCENSNTKTFSERQLHSIFDGTLNLLVAEAGMGKSTFMKYLRNECFRDFWPIYADLKSHFTFFSQVRSNEEVLAHFMKMGQEESNFLQQLEEVFQQRKKVVLFLDGLDELPMHCVENVLKTSKSLSLMGYHVWLSSRPNFEKLLSKEFNLFIVRLVELSEEEQKKYIQDRLGLNYMAEEINIITDRIFEGIRIIDNSQFLGIPLQLYAITQIFLDDRKHYAETTKTLFVLTKLYQLLFQGRFHHCFAKEKYEPNSMFLPTAAEYLEQYEIAALESILEENSFKKLQIDCRPNELFLSQIEADTDVLGIVTKVNQRSARFEHQTYAEYFACVWFTKHREKVKLLKEELFSRYYEHLRLFLNMILAENNPLHLSIIYKNLEKFQNNIEDIDFKDDAGQTALHIACCSGTKYFDSIILGSWYIPREGEPAWYITMIDTLFQKNPKIHEKDGLFDFDWLEYSCISGFLYPIEVALKKNLIKFSARKEDIFRYYDIRILGAHCVQFGYPNLLNNIVKEVIQKKIFQRYLLDIALEICCFNKYKESTEKHVGIVEILIDNDENLDEKILDCFKNNVLNMACRSGHLEIVKKLLEKQPPTLDKYLNNMLHFACGFEQSNSDLINLLIQNDFDINAPNNEGTTPFLLACRNRLFDIVDQTLRHKELDTLETADKYGKNALHYAAECTKDNKKIITLLINKGVDVNSQDRYGCTSLHHACKHNNATNFQHLLKKKAKIGIADNEGHTALAYALESSRTQTEKLEWIDLFLKYNFDMCTNHGAKALNIACKQGDSIVFTALVKNKAKIDDKALHFASASKIENKEVINFLLLKKRFKVNSRDNRGMTALHVACDTGIFENVKILLEAGGDINSLDGKDQSAFDYFFKNARLAQLKFVLNKDVIINVHQNNRSREMMLYVLIDARNLEIIEKLLAAGLDEKILDQSGNNALHYASRSWDENEAIISKLIEAKFNVNTENLEGITPLLFAFQRIYFKNVRVLIQNGAELKHADKRGNNGLHYASQTFRNNDKIIDFLMSENFEVDAPNENGTTALHLACRHGNLRNVKKLLKNGANLNQLDKNEENSLHYSVTSHPIRNQEIIIDFLISYGLDVNSSNKYGRTTLQLTCEFGNFQYVAMLVEKGANAAQVDLDGNNALHYLSKSPRNAEPFIDLFISNGVDINAQNKSGQTALHLACKSANYDSFENLRTLLDSGANVNILDNDKRNVLDYARATDLIYADIKYLLLKRGLQIRNNQTDIKKKFLISLPALVLLYIFF